MNSIYKLLILFSFLFSCSLAIAISDEEEVYPIERILGVLSQANDGNIRLHLGITFPNGCYRTYATLVAINSEEKEVLLGQIASLKEGLCSMAVAKTQANAEMSRPEIGDYSVIDVSTRSQLGILRIKADAVEFFEDDSN